MIAANKRWLAWGVTGAICVSLLAFAGCAPQPSAADGDVNSVSASTPASASEIDREGVPAVRTLEDGRQVQLTPSWENTKDYTDITYVPGISDVIFNQDVLNADDRGCGSCHADLWDTLEGFDPAHLGAAKRLTVNSEVQQCIDCHGKSEFQWNANMGSMMHGLHGVNTDDAKASCFNCHEADWATGELKLWDEVKHDIMQGITRVSNVEGDFAYTQDAITEESELFNVNWMYYDLDEMRFDNSQEGTALDEDLFNNWEISIAGEVDRPQTWKLVDLIGEAPVETRVIKMHCEINPLGGPLIGQAEVTGIPLSWFMEQVGLKDTAEGITWWTPDGDPVQHEVIKDVALADLEGHDALLVYEINGERLSWESGYPCQVWIGSIPASRFAKQVSEIRIKDSVDYGLEAGNGRIIGGPCNIGLTNTVEGQIVEAGEPYTFEGYADGWTQQVAGVEFSMDNGQTWTHFDTADTDVDRWVTWNFTWTPQADIDTAYVLQMRGVLADGTVSETPLEVMVNAKTEA